MAYQALARKWRPRTFSEIVGQEHVVRALTHALEFQRLHHAYLFTGTRGVGKTTIARILAKAINCESPEGSEPCGRCSICREVDEGRFVDLIEVDAASRTKVEDTRELMENVLYSPAQGRYKVYLIDEVHMLSGHSFNALLKTLEEPPPHIKFLLATTDPQKIPVTVLSRCLQFNLKRLSPDQIGEQMQAILQREDIEFEPAAVKSLARAADGSMRDGLSLLDQAIVHGGGRLAEAAVSAMLGTVARQPVFELLEALAAGDAADLLARVEDLALHSPDFEDVLQQMLVILHLAALAQWVPDAVRREEDAERILGLAKRLSAEDLQLLYQIALVGQRDLPLAPEPRMGFEMVLLRMLAFRPAAGGHAAPAPAAQAAARPAAVAAGGAGRRVPPEAAPAAPHPSPRPRAAALPPAATAVQPEAGTPLAAVRPEVNTPAPAARSEAATPAPELAAVRQETDAIPADPDSVPATAPGPAGDWNALIQAMGLAAMTLQLANNCELESLDEESCMLRLSPQMTHLKGQIATGNLEKALQEHFRRPLKLVIKLEAPGSETPALKIERQREERQRAAEIEMEQDENVRALKERFEARIVPGSIKPLD